MSIEAQLDKVHGFPEGSREALQDYLETGKRESLDRLVVLAVKHYLPSNSAYKTDPTLQITGDKKLMTDLAMDSISLMELVFFMEDVFDVAIESTEMQGLQTITDLQNFANERLGPKIKASAAS
ncbi:MAG: phosphopantetheine-binding protein [Candidatus Methylacidiphilales bacterium]|nr:phosphopantetheine-binding protein [Candidatus Methylacidiphilales bacterium]